MLTDRTIVPPRLLQQSGPPEGPNPLLMSSNGTVSADRLTGFDEMTVVVAEKSFVITQSPPGGEVATVNVTDQKVGLQETVILKTLQEHPVSGVEPLHVLPPPPELVNGIAKLKPLRSAQWVQDTTIFK